MCRNIRRNILNVNYENRNRSKAFTLHTARRTRTHARNMHRIGNMEMNSAHKLFIIIGALRGFGCESTPTYNVTFYVYHYHICYYYHYLAFITSLLIVKTYGNSCAQCASGNMHWMEEVIRTQKKMKWVKRRKEVKEEKASRRSGEKFRRTHSRCNWLATENFKLMKIKQIFRWHQPNSISQIPEPTHLRISEIPTIRRCSFSWQSVCKLNIILTASLHPRRAECSCNGLARKWLNVLGNEDRINPMSNSENPESLRNKHKECNSQFGIPLLAQ